MPPLPPVSPTLPPPKPAPDADRPRSLADPPPPAPKPDPVPDTDASAPVVLDDDVIDQEIFHQILDLDEDDNENEFSKEMSFAYLSQAEETFGEMDRALAARDLEKLSTLGHYLKGSSAAIGVYKVQASCEKIQHFGQLRDEDKGTDVDADEALDLIRMQLGEAKQQYNVAKRWLTIYFKMDKAPGDD